MKGCLIIHGFGGSVVEIEALAKFLTHHGYKVSCPRLPGHTGNKHDFKGVTYQDWIEHCEKELLELQKTCDQVVIIGFSMGGLIAANLATRYPIHAMGTLCTPIYFWNFKRIILNLLHDIKTLKPNNVKRYFRSSGGVPISIMINFLKLLYKTRPLFKLINQPIFVAQSLLDDTVQIRSAEYIFTQVKSIQKQLKYYPNSDHLICCSGDASLLFQDLLEFLQQINMVESLKSVE